MLVFDGESSPKTDRNTLTNESEPTQLHPRHGNCEKFLASRLQIKQFKSSTVCPEGTQSKDFQARLQIKQCIHNFAKATAVTSTKRNCANSRQAVKTLKAYALAANSNQTRRVQHSHQNRFYCIVQGSACKVTIIAYSMRGDPTKSGPYQSPLGREHVHGTPLTTADTGLLPKELCHNVLCWNILAQSVHMVAVS